MAHVWYGNSLGSSFQSDCVVIIVITCYNLPKVFQSFRVPDIQGSLSSPITPVCGLARVKRIKGLATINSPWSCCWKHGKTHFLSSSWKTAYIATEFAKTHFLVASNVIPQISSLTPFLWISLAYVGPKSIQVELSTTERLALWQPNKRDPSWFFDRLRTPQNIL